MPLIIDSSRALRSPQDVAGLVQAVLAASPNDESDWVEWKNGLLLRDKEARVEIARHILGMANRRPEEAARHTEGCGYVVVGAEPGCCGGVVETDPADLDAGIQPYLGSDGPRWGMQYVLSQTNSVLVITVEPPRRGDRIFTLQKEYRKYAAGMVFVRRPGRTIQAQPGDIRALEDRYAAVEQPITLHVRTTGADDAAHVRSIANIDALFDAWEARRREELLPPPRAPYEPIRLKSGGDRAGAAGRPAAQAAENMHIISDVTGATSEPDDRTDDEYRKEVDQYIGKCREYYLQLAATRLVGAGDALMPLVLVNTSDRNYVDIHVEVHVPGTMAAGDPALPAAYCCHGRYHPRPEQSARTHPYGAALAAAA